MVTGLPSPATQRWPAVVPHRTASSLREHFPANGPARPCLQPTRRGPFSLNPKPYYEVQAILRALRCGPQLSAARGKDLRRTLAAVGVRAGCFEGAERVSERLLGLTGLD